MVLADAIKFYQKSQVKLHMIKSKMKGSKFSYALLILLACTTYGCATGNNNYASDIDAVQRCNQLWANDQTSRKICTEHLKTPYRFIRSCLERGLKPGTDEFTYCGLAAMGRGGGTTAPSNRSNEVEKLSEEIKALREQQEKAKRDKVFEDLIKEKRRY